MIKINLLPTKRKPARKISDFQKQLILAVVILVGVFSGMFYYMVTLNQKITLLQKQRDDDKAKIAQQENLLKAVKTVEDERAKVNEKINIIEQLKKNQQGPVRMLDEISRAVPASVALSALTEAAGSINITGDANSNDDLVKFVENLKSSPFLQDVYLQESSLTSDRGAEIYRFKIQMKFKGI